MSNEDNVYMMKHIKVLPTVVQFIAAAIPVTLLISYTTLPGIWIVYALTAFTLGLVHTVFTLYNRVAIMFNYIEYRELQERIKKDRRLTQVTGTNEDKACLTKETPSNGDEPDAE